MTTEQEHPAQPFAPGNIVRLKEAYRPEDDYVYAQVTRTLGGREAVDAWRSWRGFTYGMVAEVVSCQDSFGEQPRNVSLHLYDPELGLLYMAGPGQPTLPCYCDFHVSDLIPHKIATDEYYGTLPELPDLPDIGGPHQ